MKEDENMSFKYYIDKEKYRIKPEERYIRISGWCFDTHGREVSYKAELNGENVVCNVMPISRKDVQLKYKKKYEIIEKSGFQIKIAIDANVKPKSLIIYACGGNEKKRVVVT